jgi:Fe-S oxidoreductase
MGIDHSVLTRKARSIVHKLGLTPKRLLQVTEVSLRTGNTDGASPEAFLDVIEFLKGEMNDETGLDIPIPVDREGAEVFFVPPSGDVLVNPDAIMGIAKAFYVVGVDWTMSSKMFDGANYGLFTGDDAAMKADNLNYINEAKRLKCKVMMMGECGHAHRIMKFMMEKQNWWGKLPFEIINVMEFTSELVHRGRIQLDPKKIPEAVTYHDPCNFARSCGIIEEPRIILRAACQDFREMTPNRAENWCCGGGAGLSAMDTIRDFRMVVSGKKKFEQIRATGAKFVAAACSNCKRQLTQLMEHHEQDVAVGGVHDLISRSIVIPKVH